MTLEQGHLAMTVREVCLNTDDRDKTEWAKMFPACPQDPGGHHQLQDPHLFREFSLFPFLFDKYVVVFFFFIFAKFLKWPATTAWRSTKESPESNSIAHIVGWGEAT